MTELRLTPKEAAALGLDVPAPRSSSTRTVARGRYHTRCVACGEEFVTQAAENRHHESTHHVRYELVPA